MIQLVEDGEVETIILKDMSRLGRDYLVVGQLREFFRKKGVRLIAINDNHDSYNGDDDFLVFRDVMNEMYAKDISKKIKSTFKSKGKSGKHVASVTPYGYLKDENDGNHWIVDEEAAEIVRLIFKWTIDGLGPYQIAKLLQEKKVEIPAVHMARFGQGNNRNKKVKDPYGWGSSTVVGILKKREYLGHTVNFKTQKHFKDKKSHYVSEDNWVIFENTQEPIIDQQTFDTVQKLRENVRRYPDGWGEHHVLTGLMYCADCGAKMYVHRTSNGKRIAQYLIIEFPEMVAILNAKNVEDTKSFMSRQKDTYKTPYDRHPKDHKRQCVFAGSSNSLDFLPMDRSGNRRFLPILCNMEEAETHILDDEKTSREYIDQMWAEAMEIYRSGKCQLRLPKEMEKELCEYQKQFMQEDTKKELILDYLEHYEGSMVCSRQLYSEALGNDGNPAQWEIREINDIMNNCSNWIAFSNPRHFPEPYRRQKGWEKPDNRGQDFQPITKEQMEQLSLPPEWMER